MNKLEVREICFNIISKTGKAMDSIDKSLSLAKNDNFEDEMCIRDRFTVVGTGDW